MEFGLTMLPPLYMILLLACLAGETLLLVIVQTFFNKFCPRNPLLNLLLVFEACLTCKRFV